MGKKGLFNLDRYFIEDGTRKIHITEWGDNQSPVIFCLHGLGSTSLSFIEIAEQLKDEYRIISMDAPGHGQTSPFLREEEYSLPPMAKWLDHVLDKLGIKSFYLLAHSWGGFLSLFYLLHNPNRVKGTILIDGGYQTKRRMDQTLEGEIAYYKKDFNEYRFSTWDEFLQAEKKVYTRWSPLMELAVKDLAYEKGDQIIWHANGDTAKNYIIAMHKDETEDIYDRIESPIVLLVPEELNEYRSSTLASFRDKTSSIIKKIPNSTHLLHWDQPNVVVEEIKKNWS